MGKRRNRKKTAYKQLDTQLFINFPNGNKTSEDGKNLSQKTSREYNGKTSRGTSENDASSKSEPVKCKTFNHTDGTSGSKSPAKNYIRPREFTSENDASSKSALVKCKTFHHTESTNGSKSPTKNYIRPSEFTSENAATSKSELVKCKAFNNTDSTSGSRRPTKNYIRPCEFTSENEAPSKSELVKFKTFHHTESISGSRSPAKNYIKPREFTSENRFSLKDFADSFLEEPQVVDTHEYEFKNSYDKSLDSPKWVSKVDHNRLNSYTSAGTGSRSRKCFESVLNRWLPVRDKSIRKLKQLLKKVSDDEATYDNLELNLKYGSAFCRTEKVAVSPSSSWDFLFSLGSFALDVAGGLTSVSHMINTDNIQSEFQEIMKEDADATKEMYNARSKYATEYQYTEEVIRKFEGTTIGETLGKISEAVGITEFFQKMEKAKNNNEDIVLAACTALDGIMTRNCNREVGREVVDAIQELVDINPACVGVAEGVGKSVYGAAALSVKSQPASMMSGALVRAGMNRMDVALIRQEQSDICKLEQKIRGGSKTTLEKRIQEALHMFETEKNEMLELLSGFSGFSRSILFTEQYL